MYRQTLRATDHYTNASHQESYQLASLILPSGLNHPLHCSSTRVSSCYRSVTDHGYYLNMPVVLFYLIQAELFSQL